MFLKTYGTKFLSMHINRNFLLISTILWQCHWEGSAKSANPMGTGSKGTGLATDHSKTRCPNEHIFPLAHWALLLNIIICSLKTLEHDSDIFSFRSLNISPLSLKPRPFPSFFWHPLTSQAPFRSGLNKQEG